MKEVHNMKKVKKPEYNVKTIVCDCAESIRDISKKNRIIAASETIYLKSEEYDSFAERQALSSIPVHDTVADSITKDEMVELYERKFVAHNAVRSKYYDKIIISTDGICPICCLGQVGNLDHYLPKALFPTYAITPYNLLPICRDCNYIKREQIFADDAEATLHPYYDDFDSLIWLKARLLIQNGGLIAEYYVDEDLDIDDKTFIQRCFSHFTTYELDKRYPIEAAREIAEKQRRWKNDLEKRGEEEFLESIYEDIYYLEAVQKNSWKVALYRALTENVGVLNHI